MLEDFLSYWLQKTSNWILSLFSGVFPEYPQIGIAVFVAATIFFLYFVVCGKPVSAVKTSSTTFVTLTLLLYMSHGLIRLFHNTF